MVVLHVVYLLPTFGLTHGIDSIPFSPTATGWMDVAVSRDCITEATQIKWTIFAPMQRALNHVHFKRHAQHNYLPQSFIYLLHTDIHKKYVQYEIETVLLLRTVTSLSM